jgi:hypothetical protein
MLKRIAIVVFFAGSGQLFSIFVLKYISQHSTITQLRAVAEVDSLVQFIMNLIALGLTTAAMRDLAMSADWKKDYQQIQSARISLGILLMAAAAFAFANEYYVLFLLAPIFAWSGDYGMYARGFSIAGSIIASVRLIFPYLAMLLAAMYAPESVVVAYIVSLVGVYIITNAFISYYLKTPYLFKPAAANLRLYIKTLPLGLASLSQYFLGLGLVLVIPYIYVKEVVATAFVGLKFYVLYKGVIRTLQQIFIKDMQSEAVCLRVDQLSIIAGLSLLGSVAIFPDSFISFFFGAKYLEDSLFFTILGVDALIYCIVLSFATRAWFLKADIQYTRVTIFSFFVTIASILIISAMNKSAAGIALGLGIGELTWVLGLMRIISSQEQVMNRLRFLLALLPVLILPIFIRFFFGDRLLFYFISFALTGVLIFAMHHKKFRSLTRQA